MLTREEMERRGAAQGELTRAERFVVEALRTLGNHSLIKAIDDILMAIVERLENPTLTREQVAKLRQVLHIRASDNLLVVYNEDGTRSLEGSLLRNLFESSLIFTLTGRKQQFECGALSRRAVHLYRGAMPLDDTADSGKTQSASRKLCREERIEYAADHIGGHTDAGVMHFQCHITALFDIDAWNSGLDVCVVDILHACSDQNGAGFPIGNRVSAVDHEVHDHLLDLRRVRLD
jgi:hypothetical protein